MLFSTQYLRSCRERTDEVVGCAHRIIDQGGIISVTPQVFLYTLGLMAPKKGYEWTTPFVKWTTDKVTLGDELLRSCLLKNRVMQDLFFA